jgi:hypothetical protein
VLSQAAVLANKTVSSLVDSLRLFRIGRCVNFRSLMGKERQQSTGEILGISRSPAGLWRSIPHPVLKV